MTGKLIVLEGVEGCGKSTQLQLLSTGLLSSGPFRRLQQQDIVPQVLTSREPGGTELGLKLRQLLLHQDAQVSIDDRTELLLYAADRAQHVAQVIKPALEQGCWVLCDRFVDSTLAYQGYGRGLNLDLIHQLNRIATAGVTPDLTLWLQLPVEQGLARARQRGGSDRMERADLSFHQRVQQGFEYLAQQYPQNRATIEAEGSPTAVAETILAVVQTYLEQWYPQDLMT
ncbi:MAG: dTMP kinase [Nodosilinea sp. LVE1205-7]|jgi:dTMP kinase